jgi:hypothetical protein
LFFSNSKKLSRNPRGQCVLVLKLLFAAPVA